MRGRVRTTWMAAALMLAAGMVLAAEPGAPGAPQTAGAGNSKEQELTGRALIVKLKKDARSRLWVEQAEAITKLGTQTDAALLNEFQIPTFLMEIAQDATLHPRVRCEALRSLVALYKNGIGNMAFLELLPPMIEDEKTLMQIRSAVLDLLAEMGGDGGDAPPTRAAFGVIKTMWERSQRGGTRNRLPVELLKKLLETIGGFHGIDDSRKILLDALGSRDADVRLGGLAGLNRYLSKTGAYDRELLKTIMDYCSNAKTPQEQLATLRTLVTLSQSSEEPLKLSSTLRKRLLDMLDTGGDEEVQTATRMVMQASPDDEVFEKLLTTALPKASRTPPLKDFNTYLVLNVALAQAPSLLQHRATKQDAKDLVTKVFDHLTKNVLNPNAQNPAPARLRQSVIYALGGWPIEFDRTNVVAILIRLLEVEKDPDLTAETVRSLEFLTGRKLEVRDPATGTMVPDIDGPDGWKAYFAKLQAAKALEPGKDPLTTKLD